MTSVESSRSIGLLCIAHGTIEKLEEIPEFLNVIRRGRPASPALITELTERYRLIGGSPLNGVTAMQASAVGEALGIPAIWGMRLWKPWVAEVLKANLTRFGQICLLPLAPFSVHVYRDAAHEALRGLVGDGSGPTLYSVEPWGSHPGFVAWFASRIQAQLDASSERTLVILTAHSLPLRAIQEGDPYQAQVRSCAEAVSARLGLKAKLAYQSQGADGGDWLKPDLKTTLEQAAAAGFQRVVVAPIGFVSEHVETLYDLDIEALGWAEQLGLGWARIPAPNSDPEFVGVLADVVRAAMARNPSP